MPGDFKKLIPILLVLILAFAGSYASFTQYNPKIQNGDVKGAQVSQEAELPMPISSEKICSSRTLDSHQTTFQTKKSPEEVMTFYQNVFSDKNWTPESDKRENGIYVTTYNDQDLIATITVTRQPDDEYTIVSLKMARR
ncbi:hypothetical protein A2380_03675 [candidate division WWE3 bacterium RIFOXYB1_FULL_43_24]|uniref:Uncharacterized protein n=1 Tax=candidate division WWE3 bacterium GW2011_GWB1_42_6 TaxID=1619115 RepID=A0A0G1D574_UNCKA|nr:MAG: hypothetical protein UV35_C0027G0009 [candidate division WWE3 bacterium GW2011_GWB1_42_6]OGC60181.1 MAG: hypothetical protein A2212_02760 [candidate division WWE3 bacterium RIFOXYA1_FULL_42_9]OGC69196.1 MAG: hypothetical protein A2380_03675 [candidate division WWE3 bacterium RIFOXYB1_FULL_43_24]OGC73270.1 MAG: hypothetical protein A2414_00250 [candidate division WWE3 bacterium RIFOXYC1_FULL_42_13]